MKITFCGAAGTTTGSKHLIEVNNTRILLDCGLYQGRRKDQYEVNCCFPHFEPGSIEVIALVVNELEPNEQRTVAWSFTAS